MLTKEQRDELRVMKDTPLKGNGPRGVVIDRGLSEELLTIARASDDAATACEAQAAAHRAEYERCLVPPPEATPALHERAVALFPYVIGNEREAARLRHEAEVLRQAATALGKEDDVA